MTSWCLSWLRSLEFCFVSSSYSFWLCEMLFACLVTTTIRQKQLSETHSVALSIASQTVCSQTASWCTVNPILIQVTVLGIPGISNKSGLRGEDFDLYTLFLHGIKGPSLAEWVNGCVVADSWWEARVRDRHQAAVGETSGTKSFPGSCTKHGIVPFAKLSSS